MKEKDLQTQVSRWIRRTLIDFYKNKNFVYHKLSDQSMDSKPSDMVLFHKWKGWVIELKLHKKTQAFAFDKVETHQIDAMTRADLSWNKWVLLIWVNIWRKKTDQFICIFDIKNWNNIINNSNWKSIKLEELKEKADEIIFKDLKTDIWDNCWNFTNLLK
jgi:penicillin-binding protein-related factor A (putative recombinase)